MGGYIPKQYQLLNALPIIRHSAELFASHPAIAGVQMVIHPDHQSQYEQAISGLSLLPPCLGGPTRQASVLAGLEVLPASPGDRVLIHDAARPFLSAALIDRLIAALERERAVIPALPLTDTIKRAEAGRVSETLDRTTLFAAQTPQAFDYKAILNAHRACKGASSYPDDAAVAEAAGIPIAIIPGDPHNRKITFPEDLPNA